MAPRKHQRSRKISDSTHVHGYELAPLKASRFINRQAEIMQALEQGKIPDTALKVPGNMDRWQFKNAAPLNAFLNEARQRLAEIWVQVADSIWNDLEETLGINLAEPQRLAICEIVDRYIESKLALIDGGERAAIFAKDGREKPTKTFLLFKDALSNLQKAWSNAENKIRAANLLDELAAKISADTEDRLNLNRFRGELNEIYGRVFRFLNEVKSSQIPVLQSRTSSRHRADPFIHYVNDIEQILTPIGVTCARTYPTNSEDLSKFQAFIKHLNDYLPVEARDHHSSNQAWAQAIIRALNSKISR